MKGRHDTAAVFLGRLVPGIRTLISVPAGIERMNFPVFLLVDFAAFKPLQESDLLEG